MRYPIEPIFRPEPALPPTEPQPLGGRNLLMLIAAEVSIGFIANLLPYLIVNILAAGALAAWLWVRRERTPSRLCLGRGLLAGMYAGLGAMLLGMVFLLTGAQLDLSTILMALTVALVMFMLPALVGGLLAGLLMRRQG